MTLGQVPRARQWFNVARLWPEVARLALLAVAYWVAVRVGHLFVVQPEDLASVWPASGLALAALLLSERRRWARRCRLSPSGRLFGARGWCGGWPMSWALCRNTAGASRSRDR